MNYRRLGKAGVRVSELSFGSWVTFGDQISDDVAEALMIKAYEGGINFFDNAEAYASGRSELVMGKILNKLGWSRDTWLVSSKVFFGSAPHPQKPNQYGLSRKHVFEACHAALKRLQVDYLDLFFCHRADPETPIEETVRIMSDLVTQGCPGDYRSPRDRASTQPCSAYNGTALLQSTPARQSGSRVRPAI
jgi:aryl-alcohol dehydrogenase-like predicted oxidoreductase